MISSDTFFPNWLYESSNFDYQVKTVGLHPKVAGGYIEPSKIQTTTPKRLNFFLKISQESSIDGS